MITIPEASKQHAGEVTRAFEAWRQGVSDSKNIHTIMGDIIRAVDEYRAAKGIVNKL